MLGLAEGALANTLPYLYQRKQFGQPIANFQGMQFQIAQAAVGMSSSHFNKFQNLIPILISITFSIAISPF